MLEEAEYKQLPNRKAAVLSVKGPKTLKSKENKSSNKYVTEMLTWQETKPYCSSLFPKWLKLWGKGGRFITANTFSIEKGSRLVHEINEMGRRLYNCLRHLDWLCQI